MTLGRTFSVALSGLEGRLVTVECHIADGLPQFTVVGLPDAACAQSPDRIRAAAAESQCPVPRRRITVNLSPASIPKNGTGFDLPIAVAVLAAGGVLPPEVCDGVVHLGELGLDGSIRGVGGVLPAVLAAARAGVRDVVVALSNADEARMVPGVRVHPAGSLRDLVHLYAAARRTGALPDEDPVETATASPTQVPDLADVVGQHEARAALEQAAAGGHHLFLIGPPGAGKTMLAARLPGILPPLRPGEALEVMAVRSLLGELVEGFRLDLAPPFVAPHHSASVASIVGGGGRGGIRPGAISQAHHGVLFLDEAAEFGRGALQALRQPLESGVVSVSRQIGSVRYPARFQLVLAANPCPCGKAVGRALDCTCTSVQRRSYSTKLSGPLMDRIDLQIQVGAATRASLTGPVGETSATVAARVAAARAVQSARWQGTPWLLNAHVPGTLLRRRPWRLGPEVTRDLDRALDRGALTLRGYDRVLRLAWTTADLAGHTVPDSDDVGLALVRRNQGPVAA